MKYIDEEGFDKEKTYWYVECKGVTFRANSLAQATMMWYAKYVFGGSPYTPVCVGRVG